MALVNMTAGNSYTFKKENNNSIVSFATDEAHQKKHMAAGAHIGVASVTTTDWTNVNPMLTTHCTLTAASFKSITSNIAIPIIQISNENGSNNSADTNIQWYNANQNKYWCMGIDATDGNFCINDNVSIPNTATFEITAGGDLKITGNLLNDVSIAGGKDIDFLDGNSKIRFNGIGNGGNSDFLQVAIDGENRGYMKLFDQSYESTERAYLFYDTDNDRIGFQQHRNLGDTDGDGALNSSWPVLYLDDQGDLYITGDYEQTSDVRLKENIKTIENSLETIMKLRGVSYTWNDKSSTPGRDSYGLIAQELEEHLPELVKTQETDKNKNDSPDGTPTNTIDDIKTISYPNMAGHFVEAIKEQQGVIEALKKRIEILESKMENR